MNNNEKYMYNKINRIFLIKNTYKYFLAILLTIFL